MLHDKKIIIIDDDNDILKSFYKFFTKKYNSIECICFNNFKNEYLEQFIDVDIIVIDFYLQKETHTPDIIKMLRLAFPEIFILTMSSAFLTEVKKIRHLNTTIMKECLNAGANRVCVKDINEVCSILETHFKIRSNV